MSHFEIQPHLTQITSLPQPKALDLSAIMEMESKWADSLAATEMQYSSVISRLTDTAIARVKASMEDFESMWATAPSWFDTVVNRDEPKNELTKLSIQELHALDTTTRMVLSDEMQQLNENIRKELERRGHPAKPSSIITFSDNFSISGPATEPKVTEWLESGWPAVDNVKNDLPFIVRRIVPGLIAADLVGVQPMPADAAQFFSSRTEFSHRRHTPSLADMVSSVRAMTDRFVGEPVDSFTMATMQHAIDSVISVRPDISLSSLKYNPATGGINVQLELDRITTATAGPSRIALNCMNVFTSGV